MVSKTTKKTNTEPTFTERLADARSLVREREDSMFDAQDKVRELEDRIDSGDDGVSAADLVEARTAVEVAQRVLKPAQEALKSLEKETRLDEDSMRKHGLPHKVVEAKRELTVAKARLGMVTEPWQTRGHQAAIRRRDDAFRAARQALENTIGQAEYEVMSMRLSREDGEKRRDEAFDAQHAAIEAAKTAYEDEVKAYEYRVKKAEQAIANAQAVLDSYRIGGNNR